MEEKYVLVCWAESQILMEQEWFDECILMNDENHLQEIGSSAYFVPENRYNELQSKSNEIVYQIKITFQDILDKSPQYVRDYYEKLNEEEKEKFIEDNLHSASKGAEFGLSESIYDVISTIGQNLEYNDFEDN